MDTLTLLLLLVMFCLMLAFLVIFARPETATILIKTLCNVMVRLVKHFLI
jgi:hypothetical protein